MNRSVLFVIASDPRTSGRPAEAIRIAVGVGAWKRVSMAIYLCDAALPILTESPENLIDSDSYLQYLPVLRDLGGPVYVPSDAPSLSQWDAPVLPCVRLTATEFAALTARTTYVARF